MAKNVREEIDKNYRKLGELLIKLPKETKVEVNLEEVKADYEKLGASIAKVEKEIYDAEFEYQLKLTCTDMMMALGVANIGEVNYLIDAVVLCFNLQPEQCDFSKEVYPIIAQISKSEIKTVQEKIESAIRLICECGRTEVLQSITEGTLIQGETIFTNEDFVFTIIKFIKEHRE